MNDARERDGDFSGEESSEEFSRLLGASFEVAEKTFETGDRVSAEILAIGREETRVALGPAKEGVLASADLRAEDGSCASKPGDVLDLYVTSVRPAEVRLSVHPTDKNLAQDLKEAFDQSRPVEGRVVETCKGGVRVSVKGKSAFCPISQLDVKRTETGAEHVGKTYAFRITEYGEEGRNVVVSRRKLLEEEQSRSADAFLAANPDGAVVGGKVTRLEKFGAFVLLAPGVEGLAHVSELAWSRVESPADLLSVGQDVAVKILKRETAEGRLKLALSLKQATERPPAPAAPPVVDPWAKYAAGQVLTGKITRKEPYGLFIQLEPGVVGLLHQSKTSERADFRLENHKVGGELQVQIGEVKLGERRISLDLPRDTNEEEWRARQPAEEAPSALAEQLKAALARKKGGA